MQEGFRSHFRALFSIHPTSKRDLYITDLNTIAHDTTISLKKFNPSTFAYISTDTLNQNIGDLTAIKFADSNQRVEIISGINNQIASYSHYIDTAPVSYECKDFKDSYYMQLYGGIGYVWKETSYSETSLFNRSNLGEFCISEAQEGSNAGETTNYLKIGRYAFAEAYGNNLSFKTKIQLPHILPAQQYLKINVTANFRTKTDYENPNEAGTKTTLGKLRMIIKVGNQKRKRFDLVQEWRALTDFGTFDLYFYKPETIVKDAVHEYIIYYANMADQDIEASDLVIFSDKDYIQQPILIPLNDPIFQGGILEVEIYDWQASNRGYNYKNQIVDGCSAAATNNVLDCRIKKVEFQITDNKGEIVPSPDTEYELHLNPSFKDEGEQVNLIHGTSVNQISTERGALLGYKNNNYYFLKKWTREGLTDQIEYLLLRSIVSNYTYPSIKLSCKINMVPSLFGYLTYNNFLPGKKLMISGAIINYYENEIDVSLIEISKDHLNLV